MGSNPVGILLVSSFFPCVVACKILRLNMGLVYKMAVMNVKKPTISIFEVPLSSGLSFCLRNNKIIRFSITVCLVTLSC